MEVNSCPLSYLNLHDVIFDKSSSMLVARQGLGDMAVSNAFGSNTFNICIALGLPWLVHVLVYGLDPYDKMQDDGIVFMLLLLVIVLVVFYVIVMLNDWQIRLWYVSFNVTRIVLMVSAMFRMSYGYIITYVGIMIYAILNG
jgi:Ca2+/Na+ antiporter